MGKRRGRRTRSDSGGSRHNVEEGFPTFEHNQWTFEGEIERLGALARGVNRAKREGGRRRTIAFAGMAVPVFGALLMLGMMVAGLVTFLTQVF